MPHICANSPLPSIDSIMGSFAPYMVFPPAMPGMPSISFPDFSLPLFPGLPDLNFPTFPSLPKLPSFSLSLLGLPDPLLGSIRMPNLEFTLIAIQLQSFQLQNTILAMIKPMLSLLGIDLSGWLPKMPGLPNFSILDLISGNVTSLVAELKAAIRNKVRFPFVPDPIFGSLTAPDIALPHILMSITTGYLQTITTMLINLIKSVTDKLKISAMPGLPTFPSFDSIFNSLKASIAAATAGIHLPNQSITLPPFPGLPDLTKFPGFPGLPGFPSLSLPSLLSGLSFPGFPAMPSIPDPLIPTFNLPDINISLGLTMVVNNLTTFILTSIMGFIESVLKNFLGFSFPLICIDL